MIWSAMILGLEGCLTATGSLSMDLKGSGLLIFVLAALSIAWAYWAYRNTIPPARLVLRLLLGSLRAIALLLLIFLIFEPVISWRHRVVTKPLAAVLIDDSQSMRNRDASGDRSQHLAEVMEQPAWKALRDRFDLKYYAAGDTLRQLEDLIFDSLKLDAVSTDLTRNWDQLLSRDNSEELSAILLISDGGDNAGKEPQKAAEQIGTPIFAVGIGDTAAIRDASIASWLTEAQIYRGKESVLTVRIKASGLENQSANLKLNAEDGRLLSQRSFKLPPDHLETEIDLRFIPDRAGSVPLYLTLTANSAELSQENNQRALILNAAESRKKILMIRGTPSFETMFLQRALAGLEDFEFRATDATMGNKNAAELEWADALLLVGFPEASIPADFQERVRRAIQQKPKPIWIWIASSSGVNFLTELVGEVPFGLSQGGSRSQVHAVPAEYYAELDPDAESAEGLLWRDLPPLSAPAFSTRITGRTLTLINLTDMETGATVGPALLGWEKNGRRLAATFGSGYWKWGFLTTGMGGSDEIYQNLMKRLLRWLAMAPGYRSLQVIPDRRLYSAGETVRFDALARGGDGQPISSARIEVTMQGPDLAKIILEPDASGHYRGEFTPEAIGNFTYEGLALWGSDTLGADSGNFVVESYNIEKETLNQNRALLEAISRASGGAYVQADSVADLAQLIPSSPRFKIVGWSRRFFLNWDILGLIIGLLALEWIIRKRRGML